MTASEVHRSAKSILLVEDDLELCLLMKDYFSQQGFRIDAVHDGGAGLARSLDGGFDLIILDAMLPVLDGFELLRQLRKRHTTPVIMLTARTSQADRVAGLDAGADDYLPKPFGPEELLARIRAVLRRSGRPEVSRVFEAGGLWMDAQSRHVRYLDRDVEITAIEFDILEILVRAAGRTVSRDELTAALYQRRATPYERSLDVHISHLRKKLEGGGRSPIRTIRGVGYLFAAGQGDEA
jgi:two-component system, OmpR family, response regulator CpxR